MNNICRQFTFILFRLICCWQNEHFSNLYLHSSCKCLVISAFFTNTPHSAWTHGNFRNSQVEIWLCDRTKLYLSISWYSVIKSQIHIRGLLEIIKVQPKKPLYLRLLYEKKANVYGLITKLFLVKMKTWPTWIKICFNVTVNSQDGTWIKNDFWVKQKQLEINLRGKESFIRWWSKCKNQRIPLPRSTLA